MLYSVSPLSIYSLFRTKDLFQYKKIIRYRDSHLRDGTVVRPSYLHYDDVIMGAMASKINNLVIVYSTVKSGADHSKHQSSASLAFVCGIHRSPVNSLHKWPVTRKNVSIWWRHHVYDRDHYTGKTVSLYWHAPDLSLKNEYSKQYSQLFFEHVLPWGLQRWSKPTWSLGHA